MSKLGCLMRRVKKYKLSLQDTKISIDLDQLGVLLVFEVGVIFRYHQVSCHTTSKHNTNPLHLSVCPFQFASDLCGIKIKANIPNNRD
jgi:hypothetical protein